MILPDLKMNVCFNFLWVFLLCSSRSISIIICVTDKLNPMISESYLLLSAASPKLGFRIQYFMYQCKPFSSRTGMWKEVVSAVFSSGQCNTHSSSSSAVASRVLLWFWSDPPTQKCSASAGNGWRKTKVSPSRTESSLIF